MTRLAAVLDGSAARRAWRSVLALLLGVVGTLALIPADQAPDLGVGDKVQHALAFAALGAVAIWSWRDGWPVRRRAALALLAYGGAIEILQTTIPGRHAEWSDLFADAIGIGLGMTIATWARARTRRREP